VCLLVNRILGVNKEAKMYIGIGTVLALLLIVLLLILVF
jgi:hypothetical protein